MTVLFGAEMSEEDASRPRAAGRNIHLLLAHRRDSAAQVSGVGGAPCVRLLSRSSRLLCSFLGCSPPPAVLQVHQVTSSLCELQHQQDAAALRSGGVSPPPSARTLHHEGGFASFKFGAF